MNNTEALKVLDEDEFRRETHGDLVRRIGEGPVVIARQGANSAEYQLEIEIMWDGRPGGNVRVIGSIDDDGGWRAFSALTRSFIKAPDESFVGEPRGDA